MTADLEDNGSDIALTAQPLELPDLSTEILKVAELTPLPPAPKTAVSARLSQTPELSGQSCREGNTSRAGKLRLRAQPGRRGLRRAPGDGAPAAVYAPLVS